MTRELGRHAGAGANNYPNVARYPFAMLRDAGGLTVASRFRSVVEKAGLVYPQFYNLIKNAFDAGTPHFLFHSPHIFPFLRAQINRFCFLFEQKCTRGLDQTTRSRSL